MRLTGSKRTPRDVGLFVKPRVSAPQDQQLTHAQ